MDAYEKALRIDDEFLPALFAQAALIEAGGDRQGAARKYREILVKSDTFMPALNNLAYIYIDDEKLGKLQEGLRLAFSGFRLAPGNPATMDTLGFALVKNGRSADAVKLLENATTLLPDDRVIASHLALAYAAQGTKAIQKKIVH
jgi:tetratricopeptide (TPR) repeat protein